MERVNQRVKELIEVLQRKDLLKKQLSKAFALGKEMQGKVLGNVNWYKRIVKQIYTLFRDRELWIVVNEKQQVKYFEKLTQVQAEKLNTI